METFAKIEPRRLQSCAECIDEAEYRHKPSGQLLCRTHASALCRAMIKLHVDVEPAL